MRKPALGWIVAAVAMGLGIASAALTIADAGGPTVVAGVKSPGNEIVSGVLIALLLIVSAGIGGLVAARRPDSPIGWLLLITPIFFGLIVFSEELGWHLLLADRAITFRAAIWLAVGNWAWILAVTPLFIFLPLLFPTGRPLSPRWSRFTWGAGLVTAVAVVSSLLMPGPIASYHAVDNPIGAGHAWTVVSGIGFGLLAFATIASIASLALRFRRSRGVQRQQIKWVWAAGTLLVLSFVLSGLLQGPLGGDQADSILFIGLLGLPAAVAVAVLRYRLYDIAVVVNRTLVYGSLTATLAGVYLASVLLLQLVLDPVTAGSSLAVAVSTLAVAGLFGPARRRIQAIVDRRFYRRKYDATRTLDAFNARLREELDLDSLSSELRAVLEETMQPTHVSLWLRPSGE
jgi:hypothetical protein